MDIRSIVRLIVLVGVLWFLASLGISVVLEIRARTLRIRDN
jgi:hypothetical protein